MEKSFGKSYRIAPEHWMKLKTIEMHTGGEPLRIILDGLPDIEGKTILEKSRYFRKNYDHIRQALLREPRGHADMYGAIITAPVTDDADFGVFFIHNEGYSSMCGHAIIALTVFAIETGLVKKGAESADLIIDVPSGRVRSKASLKNGRVVEVSFENVPSFVLSANQEIIIPGIGEIRYSIAYGGAFYVLVNADDFQLHLSPSEASRIKDLGMKVKVAVMQRDEINHPFEKELGFLYGTIFIGKAHNSRHHSRNVCVFADGQLDRSATGTGVSARAALHHMQRELPLNEKITIESIINTTLDVEITGVEKYGPYDAIIPCVTGQAYFTGQNTIYIDPDDPLKEGFLIR